MPAKTTKKRSLAEKPAGKVAQKGKRRTVSRKPGRPKKDDELRDKILDHAEIVFAQDGYLGSSTRQIAVHAGVTQSLIRYYFGTKEQMYREVFLRRGKLLATTRLKLLEELLASKKSFGVKDVLMAYLKPQWDMKYDQKWGAAFAGLQARLHSEPEKQALQLRREIYDVPVKKYLEVLGPLLPHVPATMLSVRMSFLVGTYMFMLNDLGRIGDFTDGEVTSLGKKEMLEQLVSFLSAGMRAKVP